MTKRMAILAAVICMVAWLGPKSVLALGEGDPVKLSVTVAGDYTDNRDSVPDGEDNIDLYVVPCIQLFYKGQVGNLNLHYRPAYRYRTDPSDIQNESELLHDLGLDGDYELVPRRVKVSAGEQFYLTDDPAIIESGTTLRRDCSYILNQASAGAMYLFDERTYVELRGRHHLKRYDEQDVADESDENSLNGRLSLYRAMHSNKLGLMVLGSYEAFDYESVRGLERGFDSMMGGVGLVMRPGKMLKTDLYVGYTQLEYQDAELGTDSAPYGQLLVSLNPHDRTEIRVSGTHSLRNSDVYPYASQKYTSGALGLTWKPEVSWVLDLSGEYRHGEYDLDAAPVQSTDPTYVRPVGGDEDAMIGSVSVQYIFGKGTTSVRLTQSYQDVDSDVSSSFTRNATRLEFAREF